jgi:phenylacetate-coenzyme A ligase PaaK-like adenylate-forming protein
LEVVFGRTDPAGGTPSRRDRRLTAYLRREVAAYSPFWRTSLAVELDRVPPRPFADLAAAGPGLVLRPDVASVYHFGSRRLAARMAWSRLWGRQRIVNNKALVPRYKPLLWTQELGAPIAYSQADVDRLGRIGARWLISAGVTADVVVVSILPSSPPSLDWWQTVEGCRRARLSAIHLSPTTKAAEVARLRPSVLVGRPMDLLRLLRETSGSPRLVLSVGRPLDDGLRARISAAANGAPVLAAWAPPGVRALWAECQGGGRTGMHTWPASEIVELIDPLTGNPAPRGAGGQVVWSPLGWRGTVMLRLRTDVFATIDGGICPACGREGPRLSVSNATPQFVAVLDRHPDVLAWQAELRTVNGDEELIVFLATERDDRLDPMLRELDEVLSVTQFVVLPQAEVDERVAGADDARVVDLRPS